MERPHLLILMGVAGSGKSTIGEMLASGNQGCFHDADDFHPPANVAKMAAGLPLTDEDRWPWLDRMRQEIIDPAPPDRLTVLACSALKKSYRARLNVGTPGIALIYLKGDPARLQARLKNRQNHFMKADMLAGQLAILEEPTAYEGITIEITGTAENIVAHIQSAMSLRFPPQPPNSAP